MNIEFDTNKDAINRRQHGLSLIDAALMDFDNAIVVPDLRFDYGEPRFQAFGMIEGRLHMLAFTMRGETLRVISLRKASPREVRRHDWKA